MRRIYGGQFAGLAAAAIAFSLTACGPAPSASSSAPTRSSGSSATSSSPAAVATASPGAPSAPAPQPSASARFVPMQTATGGEFASPSGNITCQVSAQQAYCQSNSPAQSVTLSVSGQYKTCTGQQCLGNAGEGTPTLAYGTATGVGSFRCESAATGITCTANGRGFQISTSGVTAVSS